MCPVAIAVLTQDNERHAGNSAWLRNVPEETMKTKYHENVSITCKAKAGLKSAPYRKKTSKKNLMLVRRFYHLAYTRQSLT